MSQVDTASSSVESGPKHRLMISKDPAPRADRSADAVEKWVGRKEEDR